MKLLLRVSIWLLGPGKSALRKYWAFFLPWLLVAAIFPLHEVARLQFEGSEVVPDLYQASIETYDSGPDLSLQGHGKDFDSLVRTFWFAEHHRDNEAGRGPAPIEGARHGDDLIAQFPHVTWLPCIRLWATVGALTAPMSTRDVNAAVKVTQRARALEPNNAFPELCGALWEQNRLANVRHNRRRLGVRVSQAAADAEDEVILARMHRAAVKPYLDDHLFDVFTCVVRARNAESPLAIEEKYRILAQVDEYAGTPLRDFGAWCLQKSRDYRARGKTGRAVQIATDVARLGALMLRGRNSMQATFCGHSYVALSYTDFFPKPAGLKPRARRPRAAANRAWNTMKSFLQAQRMPDALQTLASCRSEDKRLQLWRSKGNYLFGRPLHDAQLLSVNSGRDEGLAIIYQTRFLVAVWLLAAALCWRRNPPPAPARDRVAVAVLCALFSGALGLVALLGIAGLYSNLWLFVAPASVSLPHIELYFALAFIAFPAPVILSWLACTIVTWRRHRELFRVGDKRERELALSPTGVFLLCHGTVVVAWCCGALLVTLALAWGLCLATGMGAAPMDGVLTNFGLGAAEDTVQNLLGLLMIYSWVGVLAAVLGGIAKWRWLTAAKGQPAANAGLRWWKESLGAYLILLSWLYLTVGILHLPARRAAAVDFERVLRLGELGALYENKQ